MKHLLASTALVSLVFLTGCDDDKDHAVKSFTSVEECKAGIAEDATQDERDKVVADCQKAYDEAKAEHQKKAPRYQSLGECVDLYGAANCGLSPHGNYYQPSMNGFMLGYLAGQMTYQPYSGHGVSLSRPSITGNSTVSRPSVTGNTAVNTPSSSSTRGGFGASAASHSSSFGSSSSG